MGDAVYKIVELTGSSKSNIESAIQNALTRAAQTIRNMRWFQVVETRGYIEDDRVSYWQVTLKIGFNVENNRSGPVDRSAGQSKAKSEGRYRCTVCGYIYDPEKGDPDNGIKPGTAFKDLPDDWKCPECGVGKDKFEKA